MTNNQNTPDELLPVEQVDRVAKAEHARAVYARTLEKWRIALMSVHDGLEDEGDRVYLGSTNHADLIREAWQEADALKWDEILAHTQPDHPLAATNLRLQEEITRLKASEQQVREDEREKCANKMLDLRAMNAGDFKRSGANWEGYDAAILDAFHAIRNLSEDHSNG